MNSDANEMADTPVTVSANCQTKRCLYQNLISVEGNNGLMMPTQSRIHAVHRPHLPEAIVNSIGIGSKHYRRRIRPYMLNKQKCKETAVVLSNDRRYTRNIMTSLWITLLCIVHNWTTTQTVRGSPSRIAFTPPPPVLTLAHPLSLQRSVAIQLSSTGRRHSMASSRNSSQHLHRHAPKRSPKNIMSKIKSPSNSYSQFYKEGILVGIERTSPNSRRISGEVIMDTSIDAIWAILTDYDNLNVHVPNLMESKVINRGSSKLVGTSGGGGSNSGPRVHQKGAQRIFGFEFSADVTLEMKEIIHHPGNNAHKKDEMKTYSIDFQCIQSQFFSQFDGSWILEEYSRSKTMVRYIVDVMPKGPVPVAALEWRIKEDVPINILAVSKSARSVTLENKINSQSQQSFEPILDTRKQQEKQLSPPPIQQQKQLGRLEQSQSPRRINNPLQQLTDLATRNIKQTAKLVFSESIMSTAEQAISTVMSSTGIRRIITSSSSSTTRKQSDDNDTSNGKNADGSIYVKPDITDFIDWYQDETMAVYLNDFSEQP